MTPKAIATAARTALPIVVALVAIAALERTRPLRPPQERPWRRDVRNLAIGVGAALAVRLIERPLVEPAARLVERRRLGLLQALPAPPWLRRTLAVVAMDYTLYLWHVLMHRWPPLWRLHRAHHADLEVSASTAVRIHAVEMLASAPWRVAQTLLLGVDRKALALWRGWTLAATIFHHANIRLPASLERALVWVVATPRMHGIHHSIHEDEANANWGSGLSLWDRLHGTLRLDRPQRPGEIGVADLRRPEEVRLLRSLAIPFAGRPARTAK